MTQRAGHWSGGNLKFPIKPDKRTKRAKKRAGQRASQKQEAAWAARSGPVITRRIDDPLP